MYRKALPLLVLSLSLAVASPALAEVFHSKKSALGEAFPGATKVEEKNIYLSGADSKWIKDRAGVGWPGRVVRAYIGFSGGKLLGFGFIDTHRIRTFNETVMLVVNPNGSVQRSFVLAFHEPKQYQAKASWWQQFKGRTLTSALSLKRDIDSISGATMTSHAGVAVTRRVLALFERKLAKTRLSSAR